MKQLSRWLRRLTGERDLREGAASVVSAAFADPPEDDVRWLAALTADGGDDHARWELRYAMRALAYHAARRDSLDDRTPAAVARALEDALAADPHVDALKREVSVQQFNVRMRAYGQALDERDARSVTERLGQLLLSFVGVRGQPGEEVVRRAGGILVRMLRDSNSLLRRTFGVATLPEDVAPSLAAGSARR